MNMLWNGTLGRRGVIILTLGVAFSAAVQAQDNSVRLDVPYVPTPDFVVKRMLELGQVKKDDYVIDLGSGDGRIAIAAAKDFGARALGIDIDPRRISEANENATKAGVTGRVTFRQQNLFETPINDANVITMYLLTSVNLQLRPRLLDELRPGTRLVSHAFAMGDWKPDAHERVENRDVYLWVVPAKVAGQWTVQDGARRFTLEIDQQFQELKGTAAIDGSTVPVVNGKLNGDQIVFTVTIGGKPATYQGKVSGDRIEAMSGPVATQSGWTATRTKKS
jgi:SAM-dependent methyltransferase